MPIDLDKPPAPVIHLKGGGFRGGPRARAQDAALARGTPHWERGLARNDRRSPATSAATPAPKRAHVEILDEEGVREAKAHAKARKRAKNPLAAPRLTCKRVQDTAREELEEVRQSLAKSVRTQIQEIRATIAVKTAPQGPKTASCRPGKEAMREDSSRALTIPPESDSDEGSEAEESLFGDDPPAWKRAPATKEVPEVSARSAAPASTDVAQRNTSRPP